MWKYQHPDFALFLLGELQKQQQGNILCDTLLQTEGVCVPAHSCVLAALSPIFSRILSTSPAPRAGQNRLLSLEAVGSHALLKLVGFLYTGEMEIESRREHEEVMAAAHRLGLRNLFEKKRVWVDRGDMDVWSCWKETGVQTEDSVTSQESEIVSEPLKIQSSTAPVQHCVMLEPNLPSSQLLDEAIPTTRGFNLISNTTVPSLADKTEASISNQHKIKAKKRCKMAKRESQLKKLTRQQNQIKLLNVEGTKSNQNGVVEKSGNVSGKDFQKLLEGDNEQKSTTTEHKEAKLDQLKVKIKLRRMSGACWESNLLVSVQGESEKKPEEVKECGHQTRASSDKCLHTPHHISVSSPLDIPTLTSSPPQADESDEHIAMLLEDMFMMGLNILPLVPLDRNLNEQDQLGPLQEQKGGQRGAEASTQGACLFVQSCHTEMRESDVSKTTTPVGSPGQRDEGFHNQSRSNTVELLTQSPEQDNLNKVQNPATVSRNSTPSLREGLVVTPKATAVPDSVATGEMPSIVMTSIPDDRPDFKLLQCLSPLESEKGDSDVPSKQERTKPSNNSEIQNVPLWLSESPLMLDFPLSSMIDYSYPRPRCDLDACQNRSCPELVEMQELKTSFSRTDLISGSSSNIVQPDVSDASQCLKKRKTRKLRRATRKSNVKGDNKCQNLEIEDQVQPRISKRNKPHCLNNLPSNSDTYGVSTRMTSASSRVAAGVKRRREISSPLTKQHKHVDVLPITGVVKRGRGRPPKSQKSSVSCFCVNTKKMPTSGQDDCEVEKTKTDNEIDQGNKQEPNTQLEKDSTEMEEADVKSNIAQAMPISHLKYAGQAKGPSILDQIFHQALPSVVSPACKSSLNIDQQLTSSLRDVSFNLKKFQGGKSEALNSKLVVNSGEQINKGICGEKKAEMSMLINKKEDLKVSDNHARSPLSCGNVPDNVDHDLSLTKTDCVVNTNEETAMEGIEINFCLNPDSTQKEHLRDEQNSEATLCNESSCEMTSDSEKNVQAAHGVDTQDIGWAADCLENNEKEVQMMEENMAGEETEVFRAHKFVEENALLVANEITNGLDNDDDGIGVEGPQDAKMIDGQTFLEEEELSQGHIASATFADDSSKGACLQEISTDAPSVQAEGSKVHSPNLCSEDVSMVLSIGANSESKDDFLLDDEDIEVDILGESVEEFQLGLLAGRQVITLPIDGLLDQEDELDTTEEEEVDVTGEETE